MAEGLGAILGGAAGTVIGGPAGTALGSTIGGGIDALIANRRAKDKANIPMYDPEQLSLLDEIARKRKETDLGTDPATQSAIREVGQAAEGSRAALTRASGGAAGATIDALLKSQKLEGQGINQALAQGQARSPFLMGLQESLQDKISQRALDMSMFNRVSEEARAAQYGKESLADLMAGSATGTFDDAIGNIGNKIGDFASKLRRNKTDEEENPIQLDLSQAPRLDGGTGRNSISDLAGSISGLGF